MAVNTAPTFANRGTISTVFKDGGAAHSVVLQADGRIVVLGEVSYTRFHPTEGWRGVREIAVARYNADGSIDRTFHADGQVVMPFRSPFNDEIGRGVLIQPDGRIVVAGDTHDNDPHGHSWSNIAALRYDVDGILDAGFDGDGKVFTGANIGHKDTAAAVALQPDGKIVIGGRIGNNLGLFRYNTDGSLDTSFDGDGTLVTGFNGTARGVAIQADGKIVVTVPGDNLAIVRYNANGSVDASFDGDGKANTNTGGDSSTIVLQPDGKILVGGATTLARYNTNGSLDATLDGDGIVDTAGVTVTSLVLQSDGRIVTGGSAVLRYNADGTPDTTFDGDGKADVAGKIAVQADGKIVLLGPETLNRLNANGSIDSDFAPGSTLERPVSNVHDLPPPFVLGDKARVFDAELAAQGHYAGATLRLERHGGANADDAFSLGAGDAWTITANSGGVLALTFNSNATQAVVDSVLRSIRYQNNNPDPSGVIQIDWTFSDGNTGSQGTSGPLSVTGSTFVHAKLLWTRLADGLFVDSFDPFWDPRADAVRFDDQTISAADVRFDTNDAFTSFTVSHQDKTVTFQGDLRLVYSSLVTFDDGSVLLVGDNSPGWTRDGAANSLTGGNGHDRLIGLGGDDILNGGAGDDAMVYHTGFDTFDGGPGSDTADFSPIGSALWVNLTSGTEAWTTDHATLSEGQWRALADFTGIENVVGTAYSDSLTGDASDNAFGYIGGFDILNGGGGSDTASFLGFKSAVWVDLAYPGPEAWTRDALNVTSTGAWRTIADFQDIEGVIGSAENDDLSGGASADRIDGGPGDDRLVGRDGLDFLDGGTGSDTVDYSAFASAVWVNLAYGGTEAWTRDGPTVTSGTWREIDDLANVENVVGTPQSDQLVGDAGSNVFFYVGGFDVMDGVDGSDTADFSRFGFAVWVDLDYGGNEAWTRDNANVTSGTWREIADLASIENIVGTSLADALNGDFKPNVFDGGAGADTLTGGAGADTFDYNSLGSGVDTVGDFSRGAGGDHLDVRDVLVGYVQGTSNPANFVRLTESGGSTTLSVNADGVGDDFVDVFILQGNTGLALDDMIANGNLLLG